ncbi:MAG: hemolysin family protein [Bacteroidota bacterium]
MGGAIAIIIICLLLSAFFSGMEIAYVSANKVYLSVEKRQNSFISKILTRLIQDPTQFITAMLVGNSVALVIYGYYMCSVVLYLLSYYVVIVHDAWLIVCQIIVSTFIILVTAEFLPKVFFQVYANTLIKLFAVPAYLFYLAFYPFSKGVMTISNFILVQLLHTKGDEQKAFFTRGELDSYVSEQFTSANEQEEIDSEIQIFKNALEFSGVLCCDIMTPKTEVAAVEVNDAVSELRQLFIDTDYSKIVVYKGDINTIIGYVHSFELFKQPKAITDVMVSIEHVPGTMYIKEVLSLLTRKRKSMAVVLNQEGKTTGLVTIEDIIEELFGEIEDEHDDEASLTEESLPDGSYLFSARLDVDYLNQKYGLKLPEDTSYSTLGGLIVHGVGNIPVQGARINLGLNTLVIERGSAKFIELVKVVTQPFE